MKRTRHGPRHHCTTYNCSTKMKFTSFLDDSFRSHEQSSFCIWTWVHFILIIFIIFEGFLSMFITEEIFDAFSTNQVWFFELGMQNTMKCSR